jgi:uncharacterized protein (TIGR03067 family)
MTRTSMPRPNLEHFRGQAKALLAALRSGDTAAAQAFSAHLPAARGRSPDQLQEANFKLADAQSVIARHGGFASWPALVRHVGTLRSLEGEWAFESLQVDGNDMPAAMLGASKLLFDGNRFRMESPEANYDGHFGIDTSHTPMHLDIEFVQGPEAGNSSHGIFEIEGDHLTICLGVVGATRPGKFETVGGNGHALERLRRASAKRPAGVTGGNASAAPPQEEVTQPSADASLFEVTTSPALERLEGLWKAVRLVTNGQDMQPDWLAFGSRVVTGNESKVTFGGQVMLHVKMRINDTVLPVEVDYLHLTGSGKGKISLGIMEWVDDEVRFLIAAPGKPRPSSFAATDAGLTLSCWTPKKIS